MFDRKKQLKWASLKVGIVITLTIGIIFFVILFSGGIQSLLKERVSFNIYISDVKGLRKGATVRIAGVDVGEVNQINLSMSHGTIVKVSVDKDVLPYLKADAKATVQTIGLLGDKYIEIFTGDSTQPLDLSKGIVGYPQIEAREIMVNASSTLNKIESFISKLDLLIGKIDKSEGTIPKLLSDPTLYNNLNTSVLELRETIREIRYGSIGMLARDKDLYEKVNRSVKNIEEISNKITSSEGTLGKLVNDSTLYDKLLSSSERLNGLLTEVEKSEGTLNLLIKDKKTAEDLKQTINELKELIEEVKKNPKKFFKFSVF
ncbi:MULTISPECIES: MlaD family protein [Thermodesulfovibrio]|jgi:phospholipid/cholesterol/gamma-HCH transport system substrate-binding protein|uniref:MlaD family protein n=1 Tax=Thermodesulfovibrio TaxID=28261 RepID=UPI00262C6CC9|nr:MlaD family protein [Thermodesulfovibrio sp.]